MQRLLTDPKHLKIQQDILKQLGFIKKHLRYPLSSQLLFPTIPGVLLFPLLLLITLPKATSKGSSTIFIALLSFVLLLPGIIAIIRFVQSLKFRSVPASKSMGENIQLVQAFLNQNNLAWMQHPDAIEVILMMSQNLDQRGDTREVVVFIADNDRILINSHFSFSAHRKIMGQPHYKSIAAALQLWIQGRLKGEENTSLRPI